MTQKSKLKKEIKEQKQNEVRCLLCADGLGFHIGELEKINKTVLMCLKCLTGDDVPPSDQDMETIRKSWEDGGVLLNNHQKNPPEAFVIKLIETMLKSGILRVYWQDKKVYMEADEGGTTIELDIYRNKKDYGN